MILLLLISSLLSVSAFAAAPQLSCTQTSKGTQQQLTITPNALGSHDVSLLTQTRGRQPQRTWLALQLACTQPDTAAQASESTPAGTSLAQDEWHCTSAQPELDSAHAHSSLHSKSSATEVTISITSPLVPEIKAQYSFARENCTAQAASLRENRNTPSCQAHFHGAHYDPNRGDCVENREAVAATPFLTAHARNAAPH